MKKIIHNGDLNQLINFVNFDKGFDFY